MTSLPIAPESQEAEPTTQSSAGSESADVNGFVTRILAVAKFLLSDPLSKETRVERKTLLAFSAIGIVVVKTGLIPSKIVALGIEFSATDKAMFLKALACVIVYFVVAFLIYAWSDYLIFHYTHGL